MICVILLCPVWHVCIQSFVPKLDLFTPSCVSGVLRGLTNWLSHKLSTDFKSSESRNEIAPTDFTFNYLGPYCTSLHQYFEGWAPSWPGSAWEYFEAPFPSVFFPEDRYLVTPVIMRLASFCQFLPHWQAMAMSTAQNFSLTLVQTYSCHKFCTEGIGNPCHSSSVLSSHFSWNPTYVEPDKLSALWVAFHWCEVPGPIYLKPAWWSESVRLSGFMACLQPARQSFLRCLIERKNYRQTLKDMHSDQYWQWRKQEESVCYWVLYGGVDFIT